MGRRVLLCDSLAAPLARESPGACARCGGAVECLSEAIKQDSPVFHGALLRSVPKALPQLIAIG